MPKKYHHLSLVSIWIPLYLLWNLVIISSNTVVATDSLNEENKIFDVLNLESTENLNLNKDENNSAENSILSLHISKPLDLSSESPNIQDSSQKLTAHLSFNKSQNQDSVPLDGSYLAIFQQPSEKCMQSLTEEEKKVLKDCLDNMLSKASDCAVADDKTCLCQSLVETRATCYQFCIGKDDTINTLNRAIADVCFVSHSGLYRYLGRALNFGLNRPDGSPGRNLFKNANEDERWIDSPHSIADIDEILNKDSDAFLESPKGHFLSTTQEKRRQYVTLSFGHPQSSLTSSNVTSTQDLTQPQSSTSDQFATQPLIQNKTITLIGTTLETSTLVQTQTSVLVVPTVSTSVTVITQTVVETTTETSLLLSTETSKEIMTEIVTKTIAVVTTTRENSFRSNPSHEITYSKGSSPVPKSFSTSEPRHESLVSTTSSVSKTVHGPIIITLSNPSDFEHTNVPFEPGLLPSDHNFQVTQSESQSTSVLKDIENLDDETANIDDHYEDLDSVPEAPDFDMFVVVGQYSPAFEKVLNTEDRRKVLNEKNADGRPSSLDNSYAQTPFRKIVVHRPPLKQPNEEEDEKEYGIQDIGGVKKDTTFDYIFGNNVINEQDESMIFQKRDFDENDPEEYNGSVEQTEKNNSADSVDEIDGHAITRDREEQNTLKGKLRNKLHRKIRDKQKEQLEREKQKNASKFDLNNEEINGVEEVESKKRFAKRDLSDYSEQDDYHQEYKKDSVEANSIPIRKASQYLKNKNVNGAKFKTAVEHIARNVLDHVKESYPGPQEAPVGSGQSFGNQNPDIYPSNTNFDFEFDEDQAVKEPNKNFHPGDKEVLNSLPVENDLPHLPSDDYESDGDGGDKHTDEKSKKDLHEYEETLTLIPTDENSPLSHDSNDDEPNEENSRDNEETSNTVPSDKDLSSFYDSDFSDANTDESSQEESPLSEGFDEKETTDVPDQEEFLEYEDSLNFVPVDKELPPSREIDEFYEENDFEGIASSLLTLSTMYTNSETLDYNSLTDYFTTVTHHPESKPSTSLIYEDIEENSKEKDTEQSEHVSLPHSDLELNEKLKDEENLLDIPKDYEPIHDGNKEELDDSLPQDSFDSSNEESLLDFPNDDEAPKNKDDETGLEQPGEELIDTSPNGPLDSFENGTDSSQDNELGDQSNTSGGEHSLYGGFDDTSDILETPPINKPDNSNTLEEKPQLTEDYGSDQDEPTSGIKYKDIFENLSKGNNETKSSIEPQFDENDEKLAISSTQSLLYTITTTDDNRETALPIGEGDKSLHTNDYSEQPSTLDNDQTTFPSPSTNSEKNSSSTSNVDLTSTRENEKYSFSTDYKNASFSATNTFEQSSATVENKQSALPTEELKPNPINISDEEMVDENEEKDHEVFFDDFFGTNILTLTTASSSHELSFDSSTEIETLLSSSNSDSEYSSFELLTTSSSVEFSLTDYPTSTSLSQDREHETFDNYDDGENDDIEDSTEYSDSYDHDDKTSFVFTSDDDVYTVSPTFSQDDDATITTNWPPVTKTRAAKKERFKNRHSKLPKGNYIPASLKKKNQKHPDFSGPEINDNSGRKIYFVTITEEVTKTAYSTVYFEHTETITTTLLYRTPRRCLPNFPFFGDGNVNKEESEVEETEEIEEGKDEYYNVVYATVTETETEYEYKTKLPSKLKYVGSDKGYDYYDFDEFENAEKEDEEDDDDGDDYEEEGDDDDNDEDDEEDDDDDDDEDDDDDDDDEDDDDDDDDGDEEEEDYDDDDDDDEDDDDDDEKEGILDKKKEKLKKLREKKALKKEKLLEKKHRLMDMKENKKEKLMEYIEDKKERMQAKKEEKAEHLMDKNDREDEDTNIDKNPTLVKRNVVEDSPDKVLFVKMEYPTPVAPPEIYNGPHPGAIRVPKCICTDSPNSRPYYPSLFMRKPGYDANSGARKLSFDSKTIRSQQTKPVRILMTALSIGFIGIIVNYLVV